MTPFVYRRLIYTSPGLGSSLFPAGYPLPSFNPTPDVVVIWFNVLTLYTTHYDMDVIFVHLPLVYSPGSTPVP